MLLPKFYPFFRQCVILKIGNVFSLQLLFTFHELVTIHLVLIGMARRDCYGSTLSAKEFRHQCILCEVIGRRDRVMATACSDLPVAWVRFSDLVDVLVELVCGSHPCSDVFSQVSSCFFLS